MQVSRTDFRNRLESLGSITVTSDVQALFARAGISTERLHQISGGDDRIEGRAELDNLYSALVEAEGRRVSPASADLTRAIWVDLQARAGRVSERPAVPSASSSSLGASPVRSTSATPVTAEGAVAQLRELSRRFETAVGSVTNAAPGADGEALLASARSELAAQGAELRAQFRELSGAAEAQAALETSDPARYAELQQNGTIALTRAALNATRNQLTRTVDAALRLYAASRLADTVEAQRALSESAALIQEAQTAARDPQVSDRTLDALAAREHTQGRALEQQIHHLEAVRRDAQAVIARYRNTPEDQLDVHSLLELRGAQMALAGVAPGEGDHLISLDDQLRALRSAAIAVETNRAQLSGRYQIMRNAVDAQLRSLGMTPGSGVTREALWADLTRLANATGTTIPALPTTSYGAFDAAASSTLRAATEARVRMLLNTAILLHDRFGIDLPAYNSGHPRAPALDANGLDRELSQALTTLARVTEAPTPITTEALNTALNATLERMATVREDSALALAQHLDTRGGSVTTDELRAISTNLELPRTVRETARTIVANPELLAAASTAAGNVQSRLLRELAARAHNHPLAAAQFYRGAENDGARLSQALSARNIELAVTILRPLSVAQRQALLLEYRGGATTLTAQLNALSGTERGWVQHYLQRADLSATTRDLDARIQRGELDSVNNRIEAVSDRFHTFRERGAFGRFLGLRASEPVEQQMLDALVAARGAVSDYRTAVASGDAAAITRARAVLAERVALAEERGSLATNIAVEQTEATERGLRQALAISNAVTITATATALTLYSAGALGPTVGSTAAAAIAVAAGTLGGTTMAAGLSALEQRLDHGRVDSAQFWRDTRDGAALALTAAVTAGTSTLAMEGVAAVMNSARVMSFLNSGTRLASAVRLLATPVTSAVIGAGSTGLGNVAAAGLRRVSGDREGAARTLSELPLNMLRAGLGGALLGPVAGRLNGMRGMAFASVSGAGEQVLWNRIQGRPLTEGVVDAVLNNAVLGLAFEAHGNQTAARRLSAANSEGHLVRLPGEPASARPSWRISGIDLSNGTVRLTSTETPRPGRQPATRVEGAAPVLTANERTLPVRAPNVERAAQQAIEQVLPSRRSRAQLQSGLAELRGQLLRNEITPEVYGQRVRELVERTVATQQPAAQEGREAARRRLQALPGGEADPLVREMSALLDTAEVEPAQLSRALIDAELTARAEADVRANSAHLEGTALRDALAARLEAFGVPADRAEVAAARRAGVDPRPSRLSGVDAAEQTTLPPPDPNTTPASERGVNHVEARIDLLANNQEHLDPRALRQEAQRARRAVQADTTLSASARDVLTRRLDSLERRLTTLTVERQARRELGHDASPRALRDRVETLLAAQRGTTRDTARALADDVYARSMAREIAGAQRQDSTVPLGPRRPLGQVEQAVVRTRVEEAYRAWLSEARANNQSPPNLRGLRERLTAALAEEAQAGRLSGDRALNVLRSTIVEAASERARTATSSAEVIAAYDRALAEASAGAPSGQMPEPIGPRAAQLSAGTEAALQQMNSTAGGAARFTTNLNRILGMLPQNPPSIRLAAERIYRAFYDPAQLRTYLRELRQDTAAAMIRADSPRLRQTLAGGDLFAQASRPAMLRVLADRLAARGFTEYTPVIGDFNSVPFQNHIGGRDPQSPIPRAQRRAMEQQLGVAQRLIERYRTAESTGLIGAGVLQQTIARERARLQVEVDARRLPAETMTRFEEIAAGSAPTRAQSNQSRATRIGGEGNPFFDTSLIDADTGHGMDGHVLQIDLATQIADQTMGPGGGRRFMGLIGEPFGPGLWDTMFDQQFGAGRAGNPDFAFDVPENLQRVVAGVPLDANTNTLVPGATNQALPLQAVVTRAVAQAPHLWELTARAGVPEYGQAATVTALLPYVRERLPLMARGEITPETYFAGVREILEMSGGDPQRIRQLLP